MAAVAARHAGDWVVAVALAAAGGLPQVLVTPSSHVWTPEDPALMARPEETHIPNEHLYLYVLVPPPVLVRACCATDEDKKNAEGRMRRRRIERRRQNQEEEEQEEEEQEEGEKEDGWCVRLCPLLLVEVDEHEYRKSPDRD